MGRKCSVEGCLSDSNRPEDIGVTFHKVPMHSDVRPKWISLCHIPDDKKLVKIIYVCSRHFLRADFCNFKGKKYLLRQGVLPSVFPWDKSKLEAIKAEATHKKEKSSEELNLDIKKEETSNIECKADVFESAVKIENVDESDSTDGQIKVESKERLDEFEKSKLAQNADSSMSFVINSRIEALDFNNEWFPAKIVEVDYEENEVLIHFEKFSSKYDEWISMNSSRLRPLQAKKIPAEIFTVGEKCLAAWSDYRKFPATITKVMDNGAYEVLFDDGFVKVLKGNRINKVLGKLHQSPLFDPIKTSKQDRRDKKRKLNVAQLFGKRPRVDHVDEKQKKSVNPPSSVTQQTEAMNESIDVSKSDTSTVAVSNTEKVIPSWKPQWVNGAPVGTPSTIDGIDGPKSSIIIPDPRIPQGWNKHVVCKNQGPSAPRKWDVIMVSPDERKFKTRADLRKYLMEHPIEGINESMFDFGLQGKPRRKRSLIHTSTPKKNEIEENVSTVSHEYTEMQDLDIKEEENANTLKILFEDDAYKCPIEGCGKIFRRENLAQMHVKHYHPEYTKFLDSTPNVADLAYARTVGESLDRSPGPPSKPPSLKPAVKTSTPKTSRLPQSPLTEMPDLKPAVKTSSPVPSKSKDSEIIKLLNSKPFDQKDKDKDTVNSSAGLPTKNFHDLKLKDLLHKSDSMPSQRDEVSLKNFASRSSTGIKTLLPVVRPSLQDESGSSQPTPEEPPKLTGKRKKGFSENIEIIKGKESPQLQQTQPSTLPPNSTTLTSIPSPLSLDTLQQPSPTPLLPPNNIIIEGGEVIKIVRMKQEEIINCTCGFTEEDGLMIQCELCLCWQHAYCNNIEKESQVPDKYICYICQNPLRERSSRKYYHDQDWLKQGTLPVGSYHTKDEEILSKRFDKLKKCHDLSGGLVELREYMHSLGIKLKIAEAKNHPKLYLWSKPWAKLTLPEKIKQESDNIKPIKGDEFIKGEIEDKSDSQNDPMIMMLLKAEKESMSKIDLNSLMDNNLGAPIIPRPEAAIDSSDCRLNLLEHIQYQESLVEERLDDFEKQIEALEEGMNMESDPNYPKTRQTLQMLMRDLELLKEFSRCTTI